MEKQPIRFGLYFLEEKARTGIGPTLKLVLCKIAPGKSLCRSEEDVTKLGRAPPGYHSIYVPGRTPEDLEEDEVDQALVPAGSQVKAVFNDTYIMFDGALAIPTHVVSYHLEVDEAAMADDELFVWVNEQCQNTFGLIEDSFAHFFISLAQSSDSATTLCTRLRDQADVPYELAFEFAKELFRRASSNPGSPGEHSSRHADQVVGGQNLQESLKLLRLAPPQPGDMQVSMETSQEALARMDHRFFGEGRNPGLEACSCDLKDLLVELDSQVDELDEQLFDRSQEFKGKLLTYLKEYMLTLQVAEEREQQMLRCINDAYNIREYIEQQRSGMTKVALLRQWKNMSSLRADLDKRFASVAGLEGQSLEWLAPGGEDQYVQDLERQVQQKDRVVQILKQRLKTSSGGQLTEEEAELLELAC